MPLRAARWACTRVWAPGRGSAGRGMGRPGGGVQGVDAGWFGKVESGEDAPLVGDGLGTLAELAGGAGEGAHVQPVQVVVQLGPAPAGGGLGQPDEQQGQPAQQHVGADAVFLAVVDRAQVEHALHVPPAAFDFEQLLVAQRDVFDGQGGSLVRSRNLPSNLASALTAARSTRSRPVRVWRRNRRSPGWARSWPTSSARLVLVQVSVSAMRACSWASS